MVKTAASHAVNIGSNPVWVTKKEKACRLITENRERAGFLIEEGANLFRKEFVLIVVWVHLFPSRTQKLSTRTPTIVAGRLAVKIGNANTKLHTRVWSFYFFQDETSCLEVSTGHFPRQDDRLP